MFLITRYPDGSRALTDHGLTVHYHADGTPRDVLLHITTHADADYAFCWTPDHDRQGRPIPYEAIAEWRDRLFPDAPRIESLKEVQYA